MHNPFAEARVARMRPRATGASRSNRALASTPGYWVAMFAASALGTNLGDYAVDDLALGRTPSFIVLTVLTAIAISLDRRNGNWGELGYWVAIVTLRAAATNVADAITHDFAFGYVAPTFLFGIATLVAGSFTRIDTAAGGAPRIEGRYWSAMAIAGVFGTVGGDLASHTLGLPIAAATLSTIAIAAIAVRSRFLAASAISYWCVVLTERAAGTPVGDGLASRHGAAFGLPLAMACTGGALILALLVRRIQHRLR